VPGSHSMKNLTLFTNYQLWIVSIFGDPQSDNTNRIFEAILGVLKSYPPEVLGRIRNMNHYIEYLDALKTMLYFLNFIIKKLSRGNNAMVDFYIENLGPIFLSQLSILRNLPQVGSNNIRREILSQLKQELHDFFT
jgi:hypothetical protein